MLYTEISRIDQYEKKRELDQMNKIFSIINISLFITLLFCGCGNADVNHKKADDYLSQAV